MNESRQGSLGVKSPILMHDQCQMIKYKSDKAFAHTDVSFDLKKLVSQTSI